MLSAVNATALALLALLAAAVAVVFWLLLARRHMSQAEGSSSARRHPKTQFETTMGEFRDMREALRPVARSVGAGDTAEDTSTKRVPQSRSQERVS